MPRVMQRMTQRIVLSVVVLLALGACNESTRQKTLRTTLVGLNVARDGFVAWDATHQQGIVEDAVSLEDGKLRLQTYRTKRESVLLGFEIAYKSLATASLDKSASSILPALAAVKDIYDAVEKLTGTRPDIGAK